MENEKGYIIQLVGGPQDGETFQVPREAIERGIIFIRPPEQSYIFRGNVPLQNIKPPPIYKYVMRVIGVSPVVTDNKIMFDYVGVI